MPVSSAGARRRRSWNASSWTARCGCIRRSWHQYPPTAWAKHNVCLHHTGRKSFHHPAVGVLTLGFDAMELPTQPGLTLTAYSTAPGTPGRDALQLLASWAATQKANTVAGATPADDQ